MRCEQVRGNLSWFLDEMLEESLAGKIFQHLKECPGCNLEYARLRNLQNTLKNLDPMRAPDYLGDLVGMRINQTRRQSWRASLRSALEYRWSRIRTTEAMWYLTRLTGTVATVLFFMGISLAMNPLYLRLEIRNHVRGDETRPSQALARNLQSVFGSPLEAQKRPIRSRDPRINDLFLVNFAQSVSRVPQNDTVSVFAVVDANGAARVRDVLQTPADNTMLSDFIEMINSAPWSPASRNGGAVDAPLVLTFSTVCAVFN
jgi:hypothetical protein